MRAGSRSGSSPRHRLGADRAGQPTLAAVDPGQLHLSAGQRDRGWHEAKALDGCLHVELGERPIGDEGVIDRPVERGPVDRRSRSWRCPVDPGR